MIPEVRSKMGSREFLRSGRAFDKNYFRMTTYSDNVYYPSSGGRARPSRRRGTSRGGGKVAWRVKNYTANHELMRGDDLQAFVFWNKLVAPLTDELVRVLKKTQLRVAEYGPEDSYPQFIPDVPGVEWDLQKEYEGLPVNPSWQLLSFINTKSAVPVVAFPFGFTFWELNGEIYVRDETKFRVGM